MIDVRVKDHPGLVKRDKGYVVNMNVSDYESALARQRARAKSNGLEKRVAALEDRLDTIIDLLRGKNGN